MVSFYITLLVVGAALGLMVWALNAQADLEEENNIQEQSLVLYEMYQLLKTVDVCSENEEEHRARYRDIRNKYKDTLAVLGHEFPEYKPKMF